MGEHRKLIFSTATDAILAEKLSALGVGVPGDIERETFPDGERGLRLASPVADSDAFLVGGRAATPTRSSSTTSPARWSSAAFMR